MESFFLFIQIVLLCFGLWLVKDFFKEYHKPARQEARQETDQSAHEQNSSVIKYVNVIISGV